MLENGSNAHFRLRFSELTLCVRIFFLNFIKEKISKKINVLNCQKILVDAKISAQLNNLLKWGNARKW
jgi:hypothetical protein